MKLSVSMTIPKRKQKMIVMIRGELVSSTFSRCITSAYEWRIHDGLLPTAEVFENSTTPDTSAACIENVFE